MFVLVLIVSSAGPLCAQATIVELNDAGWKALRDGNTRRALSLFDEALTMRPNDPVLLVGSGSALHAERRPREAMARLQRAIELRPDLKQASVLLGHIAFDEGDVALAIRTYENALKQAPGDPVLLTTLTGWKRETDAHRTFEETRYDRFRVMFEGRAEQSLATQATGILSSAFRRIGEKLGSYPATTIVTVLYTEQQFRDITRAPDWSGAQYDGRIRVPAAGASRNPELFEHILVHELTHAGTRRHCGTGSADVAERGARAVFRRQRSRRGTAPAESRWAHHSSQGARARLRSPERASGAGCVPTRACSPRTSCSIGRDSVGTCS